MPQNHDHNKHHHGYDGTRKARTQRAASYNGLARDMLDNTTPNPDTHQTDYQTFKQWYDHKQQNYYDIIDYCAQYDLLQW